MNYITLNKNGFAEIGGFIKCYCIDPNGEYIGFIDEYIPATAGLPAGAFLDEPPADENGKTIIRVGNKWELIEDHRGETVYSTENGQPTEVMVLGDYPKNTTPLIPSTTHDEWNGSGWVTDKAKLKAVNIAENEAHKAQLRAQANSETAWRQDAVTDGYATEQEAAELAAWKKYRVLLMRVDATKAPDVEWLTPPAV